MYRGRTDLLHLLPIELRFMIKDAIAHDDLRTHACFYLSHPNVAALYGESEDQDEFWKRLCWNCGIGLLPGEDAQEEVSWRTIAVDCIQRDGFCMHEDCGEYVLEYNRERMKSANESGLISLYKSARIRGENNPVKFTAHFAFSAIRFRPSCDLHQTNPWRPRAYTYPLERDAYLRQYPPPDREIWGGPPNYHNALPGVDRNDDNARDYLIRHPIVARSFATSIPIQSISFCYVFNMMHDKSYFKTKNRRAVTVQEALMLLHKLLDRELEMEHAREYSSMHSACLKNLGWSIPEFCERFRTLRDIFTICPLSHLDHVCNEDHIGPAFSYEQR